jgi:hypothetical protein
MDVLDAADVGDRIDQDAPPRAGRARPDQATPFRVASIPLAD